jgi:hypothetical protein
MSALDDPPVRATDADTGFRCVVHGLAIRYHTDGHARCPRWRECGSTSTVDARGNAMGHLLPTGKPKRRFPKR